MVNTKTIVILNVVLKTVLDHLYNKNVDIMQF